MKKDLTKQNTRQREHDIDRNEKVWNDMNLISNVVMVLYEL